MAMLRHRAASGSDAQVRLLARGARTTTSSTRAELERLRRARGRRGRPHADARGAGGLDRASRAASIAAMLRRGRLGARDRRDELRLRARRASSRRSRRHSWRSATSPSGSGPSDSDQREADDGRGAGTRRKRARGRARRAVPHRADGRAGHVRRLRRRPVRSAETRVYGARAGRGRALPGLRRRPARDRRRRTAATGSASTACAASRSAATGAQLCNEPATRADEWRNPIEEERHERQRFALRLHPDQRRRRQRVVLYERDADGSLVATAAEATGGRGNGCPISPRRTSSSSPKTGASCSSPTPARTILGLRIAPGGIALVGRPPRRRADEHRRARRPRLCPDHGRQRRASRASDSARTEPLGAAGGAR